MPRNIQDFKDHPIYVLERHLRRKEVIYPRREIGKIGQISKTSDQTSQEAIYRRQDVHVVKTADHWFRLGRDVKLGEVPIKRIPSRRQRERSLDAAAMDLDEVPNEEVGLYAIFQTEICIPPAIVEGKVPKNAYGNIDVYVPSMIPPGGVQIRAQNARRAARILEIDYADAVTGFSFKGQRRGTAVLAGVVVAAEYKEAMLAVLHGLAYANVLVRERYRTTEMLRLWRKFLVGLRILERVETYAGDDEYLEEDVTAKQELDAEMEILDQREPDEPEENPMLALEDEDVVVVESTHPPPTPRRQRTRPVDVGRNKRLQRTDNFEEYGGGFLLDEHEVGVPDRDENENAGGFLQDEEKEGSGFLPHQSDGRGGFMADDHPPDTKKHGDVPVGLQDEPELNLSMPGVTISTAASSEKGSQGPVSRVSSTRSPTRELSNDADMESLLSHDPEDDDAEPEWLD
jgi:xeroderma pigmentosum group C-complementing protein